VAALRTRDPELVVTALREHFEHARAHLAEGWQDADDEPVRVARSGARASR
jgi:DNA-binding GntR family transcriptional regulator